MAPSITGGEEEQELPTHIEEQSATDIIRLEATVTDGLLKSTNIEAPTTNIEVPGDEHYEYDQEDDLLVNDIAVD